MRRRASVPFLLCGFVLLSVSGVLIPADEPSIVEPRGLWVPPERFYPTEADLEDEQRRAADMVADAERRAKAHRMAVTAYGGRVTLDPGNGASGRVGAAEAALDVAAEGKAPPESAAGEDANAGTAVESDAQSSAETAEIEIPVLGELGLEAFSIAPRGKADEALIVAFYGHPRSEAMGILGEYPLPQMARKLMAVAKDYDDANGEQPVLPAFHIIYATVFENADVGILNHEILKRYIDFAEKHGFAVFLDHQLGKHDVVKSVQAMLPFLQYESVHLAIDPEWSTPRPGKEIGSVTAQEINRSQQAIQDYLIEHDLPGDRMFIVHQFNGYMIQNRENVRTDFERVRLVHNADGFGPPAAKIRSWEYNLLARNIPVKGFKLFYPKSWRDGGFDYPLMSVEDVMELDPRPAVIMYQ